MLRGFVIIGVSVSVLGVSSCKRVGEQVKEMLTELRTEQSIGELDELLNAMDTALDAPAKPVSEKYARVDIAPVRTAMWQLLKTKKYGELNKKLDELLEQRTYSYDGNLVYLDIMQMLAKSPEMPDWVESTVSIHTKAMVVQKFIDLAWRARGNGYASSVSDQGWRDFGKHLEDGNKALVVALKEDPESPAALYAGVTIGIGQGWEKKAFRSYLEAAKGAEFKESEITGKMIYYLTSRWHGSVSEMSDFIKDDLTEWPDGAGKYQAMLSALSYEMPRGKRKAILSEASTQEVLNKIVEEYATAWPQGGEVIGRVAELYLDENMYAECLALCDKYDDRVEKSAALSLARGRVLWKLNRRAESIAELERGAALHPTSGDIYYQAAWVHTQSLNYAKAEPYSRHALEFLGRNDNFYRERCLRYIAVSSLNQKKWDEVLELSKKALALDQDIAMSWYLYGEGLYNTGKKEDAKKVWERSVSLDPNNRRYLDRHYPGWDK